jgi:NAD(P)-dependent dehydrogenase (short-subunit alcohol dehydrogenase family)
VLVVDLDGGSAAAMASRLDADFPVDGGHRGYGADITDEAAVRALARAIGAEFARVDGLVNGAGIISRHRAETFELARWERELSVHLTGTLLITQQLFPLLGRGSAIVNIASVGSTFGLPGRIAYSTAKSGILGFTRTLAAEWGSRGIRVNAVAPGYVDTDMVRSGFRSGSLDERKLLGRTPLGRLGEPAEIGRAIAFLLSDEASFVHGAVLKVDGGLTIDGAFD